MRAASPGELVLGGVLQRVQGGQGPKCGGATTNQAGLGLGSGPAGCCLGGTPKVQCKGRAAEVVGP